MVISGNGIRFPLVFGMSNQNKRMEVQILKKKFAMTSIALLATTTLAACAAGDNVATMEGGQVSKDELYEAMKDSVGEATLQRILLIKVMDEAVGENTAEADAEAEVATMMANFGGEAAFAQSIAQYGFTSVGEYQDALHMQFLLQDAVEQRMNLTDEDIAAYYESWEPDISAAHILVDDEQKARDLIQQINEGADFATLAQENSTDTGSARNGGNLGSFGRGDMVPEFEEAVYALEVDEVTQEPVKSDFGYHIIKLLEKPEKGSLEEEKENIRTLMVQEKMADTAYVNETMTNIVQDANVKINDEELEGAIAPFQPKEEAESATSESATSESATSESASE